MNVASLKSTRRRTGSQCSSLRTGVMCSRRPVRVISLAAAFCTDCRRSERERERVLLLLGLCSSTWPTTTSYAPPLSERRRPRAWKICALQRTPSAQRMRTTTTTTMRWLRRACRRPSLSRCRRLQRLPVTAAETAPTRGD